MDARDLDMLGTNLAEVGTEPTNIVKDCNDKSSGSDDYSYKSAEVGTECISRQAALDCFHDWIDKHGDVHTPDEMAEYRAIEALPSERSSLITWLLDKIWDEDMWELNWQAFPEILCRKLTKLGFVRERNGEYERLDQQTGGD